MTNAVIGALRINLGANTAEFSNGLRRASGDLSRFGAQTRTALAPLSGMRSGLQNAGFQITDFAVQVGGGTSAIRAFSQQAPQLLAAFGGVGIAAGTLVAVGAALVQAYRGSSAEGRSLSEVSKALSEALGQAKTATDMLAGSQAELARQFGTATAGLEVGISRARDVIAATVSEMTALGASALAPFTSELGAIREALADLPPGAAQAGDAVRELAHAFDLPEGLAAELVARMDEFKAATTAPEIAAALREVYLALTRARDNLGELPPRVETIRTGLGGVVDQLASAVAQTNALGDAMSDAAVQADKLADARQRITDAYVAYGRERAHAERVHDREEARRTDAFVNRISNAIDDAEPPGTPPPRTGGGGGGRRGLPQISSEARDAQQHLQGLVEEARRLHETELAEAARAAERLGDSLANAFVDGVTGVRSFRDALSGMLDDIGRQLLSSGLQSVFKGMNLGGIFAGIPGFARGTNFAPGGLAWVGELGPELVNLPRGSQVIPNDEIGGGGVNLVYSPAIDARGADAGAVARIERQLSEQARSFEVNVEAAITRARRHGRLR